MVPSRRSEMWTISTRSAPASRQAWAISRSQLVPYPVVTMAWTLGLMRRLRKAIFDYYNAFLNPWAHGQGICSVRQIASIHGGGFAERHPSMGASLHIYSGRGLIL